MRHFNTLTSIIICLSAISFSAPCLADDLGEAKAAYDRQEYAVAIPLFRANAERGDRVAETILGEMYSKGLGVSVNFPEAMKWFRNAADDGSDKAWFDIGEAYMAGNGVTIDNDQAYAWFDAASSSSDQTVSQISSISRDFLAGMMTKTHLTSVRQGVLDKKIGPSDKQYAQRNAIEQATVDDVKKWKADNRAILEQTAQNVDVKIESIEAKTEFDGVKTIVVLSVTNTSDDLILRPKDEIIYGWDADSPMVGGSAPIGFRLMDSFENTFKLVEAAPRFDGGSSDQYGIRPGETVQFSLKFSDVPLSKSQYVALVLDTEAVGQNTPIIFQFPSSVFFDALTSNTPH